jgi:hypothetical protein
MTTTMPRLALASLCFVLVGCAHPPPRGPIATTRAGVAPPPGHCDEAVAPHLAELCAMGEPSLSVAGPETYRFVWLRHQRNPVAVRVTRAGAGVAVVAIESDVHDPSAKRRHEFTAAGQGWATLVEHLQAADFWNLAGDPDEDDRGLDGADWILEGRRGGIYHDVIRWEPKPGPFRDACEDLIKIAGVSFPAEIR